MAFGSTFENDLVKLIFNGTAIANIADNAAAAPSTNLWVALHTADPTGGTLGTNECSYAGYTRMAVARTSSGFAITNNVVALNLNVDFPTATSTSTGTITHASIGLTSATTGGKMLTSGAVTPNINYGLNVIARLTTGSTFTLT